MKILIHFFTGTRDFAFKLVDLGAYISASGVVTFKKSGDLANTFKDLPNEKIFHSYRTQSIISNYDYSTNHVTLNSMDVNILFQDAYIQI